MQFFFEVNFIKILQAGASVTLEPIKNQCRLLITAVLA